MISRTKILFLMVYSFFLISGLKACHYSDTDLTEWRNKETGPIVTKIIVGPRPDSVFGLDMRAYLPLNQCITVEGIWGKPSEITLNKPIPVDCLETSYIKGIPYFAVDPLTTSQIKKNGFIKASFLFLISENIRGPFEIGLETRLWNHDDIKKIMENQPSNNLTLFLSLSVDKGDNFMITPSFTAPDWYKTGEIKQLQDKKHQNSSYKTFDHFDFEFNRRYFCVVMPTKPSTETIRKSISSPRF